MEPSLGLALLLRTALLVPAWEYAVLLLALLAACLYCALDFHLLQDLCTGFRGQPVQLLYNPASKLAAHVLPKCHTLKQRYWATPWICSPHLQTAFLHFFGRPPQVEYYRKLCRTPDGGTIALDWLNPDDCLNSELVNSSVSGAASDRPIVVVIPGLTSDSSDAYVKHIAHNLAKKGWRVVVANHRGLGGVSITSNQFYNAGWTEDLRRILNYLRQQYPKAPLLAVGTSIGANILVKYLGEEGENTPLGGAAAICCPWDLVVCDRFICRGVIQKLYDKVLAFGLRSYAKLHQIALSRIADWDLISKSRSIRDFDNYCTRLVGQFETVDTYYRKCSSAYYLDSVSIPLFCINAIDDPVCTKEAIPWDECRVNANVMLGVTKHGGHLAFFEGLTASSVWWVRATAEFLEVLHASSLLHRQKQVPMSLNPVLECAIDKSPYVNISQNVVEGAEELFTKSMVNSEEDQKEMTPSTINGQEGLEVDTKTFSKSSLEAVPSYKNGYELFISHEDTNPVKIPSFRPVKTKAETDSQASSSTSSEVVMEPCQHTLKLPIHDRSELLILESTLSRLLAQVESIKHILHKEKDVPLFAANTQKCVQVNSNSDEWSSLPVERPAISPVVTYQADEAENPTKETIKERARSSKILTDGNNAHDNVKLGVPVLKSIKVIAAQNRRTLWILAYVAIVTTWPLVGSALLLHGRRRLKNILTKYWHK